MATSTATPAPCPPTLTLTYLNIRGLAEPIRLALTLAKVPFDDRRVDYDAVKRLRESGHLPTGQVPTLHVDGVAFSQSAALLRWAGAQNGAQLYPDDLLQRLRVDQALEALADVSKALVPAWYGHACGRSPSTGDLFPGTALSDEQREAVLAALNDDILPTRFALLEASAAASGGPFLCGERITVADLSLYVIADGLMDGSYCDGVKDSVLKACPTLMAIVAAVGAVPEVEAWNKTTRPAA